MSDHGLEPALRTKLQGLSDRHDSLLEMMNDPEVAANPSRAIEINKEFAKLKRVVEPYQKFLAACAELQDSHHIIDDPSQDPELRELAEVELPDVVERCEHLATEVKEALVTGDDAEVRSIMLEIRAGTGGNEAALFAGDLLNMYQRFCDRHGLKVEVLSASAGEVGGFKEVVINVKGDGVFEMLGYEGGGHRVQRVPETESQGRIHTSAATVAVLLEPEEVDIQIDWDKDVEEYKSRAGGPGGQNVNKVESAIRLVHKETGLTVSMRDEKSQHKNRSKARRILMSRLYEHHQSAQLSARASTRKTMIGSGDRSQRIRTYNFPNNRCTDHRISHKSGNLDKIMLGELDELVEALQRYDRSERLKNLSFGGQE